MSSVLTSPLVPLACGFVYLLVAAFYELKTYRIPNLLTFAAIGLALVFSIVASMICPERAGGIGAAFVGMLVGGLILLPFYATGVLGAGCVKAQAACGAWIGAGLTLSTCLKFVLISSVIAVIVATVCSVVFAIEKKNAHQVTLERLGEESQSGFNLPLMHGQLPLSLGTILGVLVASLF